MLLCLLLVSFYVCPGLGLNYMQDLGVEDTSKDLDKLSAERNLTKKMRVTGESSMQTLKSTGREGISRGTM